MQISARAFQRVFTCKNRRRYSRERAPRSLAENIQYYSIVSLVKKRRVPRGTGAYTATVLKKETAPFKMKINYKNVRCKLLYFFDMKMYAVLATV